MKTYPILAIALVLSVLFFSCKQKETESAIPGYTSQELEDFKYVMSLAGPDVNFIFDHSDDRQHRHYLSFLKRQGFTSETNPALFQSIEDLRNKHLDLRSKGKFRSSLPGPGSNTFALASMQSNDEPRFVEGTGVVLQTTGEVGPIQMISGLGMLSTTQATATALSSIPDTAYYSQNSIQLFNGTGPVGETVTEEEYYGGGDLEAKVVSPYTDSGDGSLSAMMTYYYKLNANSTPVTGQFIASCKDCLGSSSCPSFQDIQPIGPRGQKSPIVVCVVRKSQGECTYWASNPNPNDIIFPVKGTVSFGSKTIQTQPNTNKVAGGVATMVLTSDVGGGCRMTNSTDFFSAPNTVVTSPNTLSWSFQPADFGNACFSDGAKVNFVLAMKVPATDGTQMCAYVSNSTIADTAVFVTYKIGPMTVFHGCLAEGTKVTLADGSRRNIEEVEVGEKTKGDKQNSWTVTSTTRGTEPMASIEIETRNGKKLILTQKHAIPTTEGVLIAKALKKGMTVFTSNGPSQIERITYVQYRGNVWNLNLGQNDEESRKLTDDNSLFYANDILVGDSRMQKIHTDLHRSNKDNVLSYLDPTWHKDYLNHVAKKKERKEN